jgi:hypothetical protein
VATGKSTNKKPKKTAKKFTTAATKAIVKKQAASAVPSTEPKKGSKRAKKTNLGDSKSGTTNGPTHAEISQRAYDIWEDQGRPEGREDQHWLAAEQALLRERDPG